MKVLHISFKKSIKDGGIYFYIKKLIKYQRLNKIKTYWLSTNRNGNNLRKKSLIYLVKKINPDIIHIHGLWRKPTRLINDLIKITENIIVAPHAMFNKNQFSKSKLKKLIALGLYERRNLKKIKYFHSLNFNESESISSFFPNKPQQIISAGTSLPDKNFNFNNSELFIKIKKQRKILLFLGRLENHKGIIELIEAWSQLSIESRKAGWVLVISGFGSLTKYVEKHSNKKNSNIIFIGQSSGEKKKHILNISKAFILPSRGEGLPIAVLEALSYKNMCLLTNECNLQKLFEKNIALRISKNSQNIKKVLIELFDYSNDKILQAGEKGYDYVKEKHDWNKIAKETKVFYKKLMKSKK